MLHTSPHHCQQLVTHLHLEMSECVGMSDGIDLTWNRGTNALLEGFNPQCQLGFHHDGTLSITPLSQG